MFYRWPPTTYHLATMPHDWHTIVRYDPSRSSKVNDFCHLKANMRLSISDHSNLGPISHRLATIHPWQTDIQTTTDDDRRQPCQKRLQHSCELRHSPFRVFSRALLQEPGMHSSCRRTARQRSWIRAARSSFHRSVYTRRMRANTINNCMQFYKPL